MLKPEARITPTFSTKRSVASVAANGSIPVSALTDSNSRMDNLSALANEAWRYSLDRLTRFRASSGIEERPGRGGMTLESMVSNARSAALMPNAAAMAGRCSLILLLRALNVRELHQKVVVQVCGFQRSDHFVQVTHRPAKFTPQANETMNFAEDRCAEDRCIEPLDFQFAEIAGSRLFGVSGGGHQAESPTARR